MKIGVYGSSSGKFSLKLKKQARTIGRLIAEKGHILITGACMGLPHEAVIGANQAGGEVIGFSPAYDLAIHSQKLGLPIKEYSRFVFVPKEYEFTGDQMACRKYRNISSVLEVDIAIFIAGETGTMNEFTNAYDFGKKIGVFEKSGGITNGILQEFVKKLTKKPNAKIIFNSDPVKLIESITA